MSDIEFIKRLPDYISHCSDGDYVEMRLLPHVEDLFCIITRDPYCDPRMSWKSWVAFAEQIIAADEAARAGGGV